jgi:hypothetical protein
MAAEGRSDRGRLWRLAAEARRREPAYNKNIQRWFAREESKRSKGVKKKAIVLEPWICGHLDIYADEIK